MNSPPVKRLPSRSTSSSAHASAARPTALEHFPTLEALYVERGVDGLQEDLIAILELCPMSAADLAARLQALLRLLQREAHHLRVADERFRSTLFAQQVRNRAVLLGIDELKSSAERAAVQIGPRSLPAALEDEPRIAGPGSYADWA